jgi:hypothetical protein
VTQIAALADTHAQQLGAASEAMQAEQASEVDAATAAQEAVHGALVSQVESGLQELQVCQNEKVALSAQIQCADDAYTAVYTEAVASTKAETMAELQIVEARCEQQLEQLRVEHAAATAFLEIANASQEGTLEDAKWEASTVSAQLAEAETLWLESEEQIGEQLTELSKAVTIAMDLRSQLLERTTTAEAYQAELETQTIQVQNARSEVAAQAAEIASQQMQIVAQSQEAKDAHAEAAEAAEAVERIILSAEAQIGGEAAEGRPVRAHGRAPSQPADQENVERCAARLQRRRAGEPVAPRARAGRADARRQNRFAQGSQGGRGGGGSGAGGRGADSSRKAFRSISASIRPIQVRDRQIGRNRFRPRQSR